MTGFIYVIRAIGTNRIKLGFSKDPAARLKQLQTGSPYSLRLIEQWPGDDSEERQIHKRLRRYLISGEWFDLPPFMIERIRAVIAKSLPSKQTAREFVMDSLPEIEGGGWWELSINSKGCRPTLRWREGNRKRIYRFRAMNFWEIECLQNAGIDSARQRMQGKLLRELYRSGIRSIARKIVQQKAS